MKHIKPYEHINESHLQNQVVYHVSPSKFTELKPQPTWFALEKDHSDHWFENTVDEWGEAYQYSGTISGKVAHITDPEIQDMFTNAGVDPTEWEEEIVGNPDAETVMALEGTKLLIDAGYAGVIYADYDPSDWNSDLDALIIFDPKTSIRNLTLVKEA